MKKSERLHREINFLGGGSGSRPGALRRLIPGLFATRAKSHSYIPTPRANTRRHPTPRSTPRLIPVNNDHVERDNRPGKFSQSRPHTQRNLVILSTSISAITYTDKEKSKQIPCIKISSSVTTTLLTLIYKINFENILSQTLTTLPIGCANKFLCRINISVYQNKILLFFIIS